MPRVDGRLPDAGDVFWVEFGGPVGHEQAGRRPALVLTRAAYNDRSSVIVVCPITNRSRRWPFQVAISPVGKITGFVLIDQIQAIDPIARACRFAGVVSEATLSEVRRRLASLISAEGRA